MSKSPNTFEKAWGICKRYWGFALGSYVVVKTMPPKVIELKDDKYTTWKRLEHIEGFFLTRVYGHKKNDHHCNDNDYDWGCDCGWFNWYSLRRRMIIHQTCDRNTHIVIPRTFTDILNGYGYRQISIEIPQPLSSFDAAVINKQHEIFKVQELRK